MAPKYFRWWLVMGWGGLAPAFAFCQTNNPCRPAITPAASLRCAFGALPMAPKPLTTGALYTSVSDTAQTAYGTYLYPNESNAMPDSHRLAGEAIAADIQPLNANGNVDLAGGKIVMVAEGMSNTNDEMTRLIQVFLASNPAVNPQLQFKNLSQPGCNLTCWVDKGVGTIDPQVQIVLMKHSNNVPQLANGAPRVPNEPFTTAASKRFPRHAQITQGQLKKRILDLKTQYPNLKLLYLTSRIYGGWSCSPAPEISFREPVAYEEGFAVKWLVESQVLKTDSTLNFSTPKAKAPWLAWGPYIWDSTWPQDWYRDDVHPCTTGQLVVAQKWYNFLMQDSSARPWFRDNLAPSTPANVNAMPVNSRQINLTWNAAKDNSGSAGKYKIYRDGVFIGAVFPTAYADTGLHPNVRYCYTVSAVDSAGNESMQSLQVCASTLSTNIADDARGPQEYKLFQNHPNPARRATEIRFRTPQASFVTVKIYNAFGAEIRTLAQAAFAVGEHRLHWDGKDGEGQRVVSGIYFYQLRATATSTQQVFSAVKRITLLR